MALKDFTMYRDFKTLKTMIRNDVIRIMPKAHKYPDALYLKEHCGTCVRYMAAASITRDPMAKMNLADELLFEIYLIRDEIEEQEEARVISLGQATRIYLQITKIEQQLLRYRNHFSKMSESDGLRTTESTI